MADQKSRSKLPTQQDINDLLEIVEKEEDDPNTILEYRNDVVPFISFYKIEPGNESIKGKYLYELYREWSKAPLPQRKFSEELNNFFIPKMHNNVLYYNINKDRFTISKDLYTLLRKNNPNILTSPKWKNHFVSFLNKFEIKEGTYWLEGYILYILYQNWIYDIKRGRYLTYDQFISFCKLYFKSKARYKGVYTWLGIDKSILKYMPQEIINNIRERHKNEKKAK